MSTTSFTALRRHAGIPFVLMLLSLCLTGAAIGQNPPAVTASAPAGLSHSTGWGAIQQTALDSNGNWLIVDEGGQAVYEFPAGGAPAITLVAPGGLSNAYGGGQPGLLLDPSNNLYIEGNFNNCLLMFPYGSDANPWPNLLSTLTSATPSSSYCYSQLGVKGKEPGEFPDFAEGSVYRSYAPDYYFQPWAIALYTGPAAPATTPYVCPVNDWSGSPNYTCNNNGYTSVPVLYNLIFSSQEDNAILSLPVTTNNAINTYAVNGQPIAVPFDMTTLVGKTTTRVISIAADPEGNVYFVEDPGTKTAPGLPGVYEIPETALAAAYAAGLGNGPIASDSGFLRVDPNLPNVTGVATDAVGNLYISDGTEGVFMVPNPSGTPQTSDAVLLTPVLAQGEVGVDPARKTLWVPTTQTQSNGQGDVARVGIGYAEFGTSNVGRATATTMPVDFYFNSSVTPASYVIVEAGMTTPEFAISGGTCTTGTAYAAQSSCSKNLTFTPVAVGNATARLTMLDAQNNNLASIVLHGTGVGANVQVSAGLESTIGATLKTPTQVVTDASGNIYVADAGLGKVLEYAAGSGASSAPVSIGTGLTAPTGVAVDGAGDVFIADGGAGNVYEVPFGPGGLKQNAQTLLVSGLGSVLNLAADGLGNLYIADPGNGQVVRLGALGASNSGPLAQTQTTLTTGASPSAPSAVAVDANNNLYVVDGANLYEFADGVGAPTVVLDSLSGITGVAVDPSGAVYLSSASGTTRIPYVSAAFVPANATQIASDVTGTSAVALDRSGNVYVTQAAGSGVTVVSTSGTLSLSTPGSLTSSTSANATITNIGNAPLMVTGYTNSTTVVDSVTIADFTGADGTCVGDSTAPATGIAPGGNCQMVVAFNPGPGEQGNISGWVKATSNAVNGPATVGTSGAGLVLADSKTAVSVGSGPQVVDTPLTVTVTPASGTVTPTGTVQVTYTSWSVIVPTCQNAPCPPTVNPVSVTASSTLQNGSASFNLSPVLAGSQTFTVGYSGDRVYGRSTGSQSATVAKSAIAGFIADPNPPPYLPFVLEQSGSTSYDGTATYFQYKMPVTVNTAAGIPTGTITFSDNSSTCPPGTSTTGTGTAICALTNTTGTACPQNQGAGVQYVVNNGTPSLTAGATATFAADCLPMPQFTTYTPVVSTHYITPQYSGDANFNGATDPASTLFQVLRSPMVNIVAAPASVNVHAGSTASTTLTLTSLLGYGYSGKNGTENDYNFPVTLSCDNLPPHTQCTFTYPTTIDPNQPSAANSVQIPCTGTTSAADNCLSGTVTVTLNTDVSTGTTTGQNVTATPIALASIFGLGMIGLFLRRKAFEKGRRLFMIVLMIVGGALAVTLSACNTTDLTPVGQLSTPTGTFPVTITATQVGTQCVTSTAADTNCTTASGGPGLLVYGNQNQVSLPFYINVAVQ